MQNNSIELKFVPIGGGVYNVELRGGIVGKLSVVTINTNTPTFAPDRYHQYQAACRKLYDRTRIGKKRVDVFTPADLAAIRQQLETSATNVLDTLDRWTKAPAFDEIAKEIEAQAKQAENLEVTISTNCLDLRRQPWHKSSLFPPNTEVIFSGINAKQIDRTTQPHPEKIRILVILGNDKGISEGIKRDRQAIEDYCKADAELVPLTQPTKVVLAETLADTKGWDIIFFSGHSDTDEKNVGRIHINATESLSMDELEQVLAPAIAKRVQIAIFNSCDGLGITPVLEKLNIDRLIVMREPIPDEVAQRFLKNFLRTFTRGDRFDDAVKFARQQLAELEDTYPYVSWVPIVIKNRLVTSPTWQSLKIRSPYKEAFPEAVELESAEAHNLRGLFLVNMNQYEEGIAAIKCSIAIDPDQACYHQHLALSYLECKNFVAAGQAIDQAIELEPQNVVFLLTAAQITHALAGYVDADYSEALIEDVIHQVNRVLELDHENVSAHYLRLDSFYGLNRLTELEAGCNRLLSIDPNHAPTYNLFGLLHQKREQWAESIEKFKIALKIQPNLTSAQNNMNHSKNTIATTYQLLCLMERRFEQETIIKE